MPSAAGASSTSKQPRNVTVARATPVEPLGWRMKPPYIRVIFEADMKFRGCFDNASAVLNEVATGCVPTISKDDDVYHW